MAHVCNLLDAAAALARRPLIALWTAHSQARVINPKAFRTNSLDKLRELILEGAFTHCFTADDEMAIGEALRQLWEMGSIATWKWLQVLVPQKEMMDRLLDQEASPGAGDSLNVSADPGDDAPDIVPTTGQRFVRNLQIRAEVLKRAEGIYEFCKVPGFEKVDGICYLKCHHIIALSAEGNDRKANVIVLCPGDHRCAYFAKDRATLEKRMIRIVEEKEKRKESGSRFVLPRFLSSI